MRRETKTRTVPCRAKERSLQSALTTPSEKGLCRSTTSADTAETKGGTSQGEQRRAEEAETEGSEGVTARLRRPD